MGWPGRLASRSAHPMWDPARIGHQLLREGVDPLPGRSSIYRALVRHGLIDPTKRRRRRAGQATTCTSARLSAALSAATSTDPIIPVGDSGLLEVPEHPRADNSADDEQH
jgi:hypothetical protein